MAHHCILRRRPKGPLPMQSRDGLSRSARDHDVHHAHCAPRSTGSHSIIRSSRLPQRMRFGLYQKSYGFYVGNCTCGDGTVQDQIRWLAVARALVAFPWLSRWVCTSDVLPNVCSYASLEDSRRYRKALRRVKRCVSGRKNRYGLLRPRVRREVDGSAMSERT